MTLLCALLRECSFFFFLQEPLQEFFFLFLLMIISKYSLLKALFFIPWLFFFYRLQEILNYDPKKQTPIYTYI